MNQNQHTTEFILGLIGSILGLVGSLFWILIGTGFWQGFLGSIYDSYITDNIRAGAFLIALVHSLISIACFILTLVQTVRIKHNPRRTGIWLLVLGILGFIINVLSLIPNILIIIAGSFCLSKNKAATAEQDVPSATGM